MENAQIYDSPEALKKFEPHYRQVRYGLATKIEKASRQQRMWRSLGQFVNEHGLMHDDRQATQESFEGVTRNSKGQGRQEEEGRINDGTQYGAGAANFRDEGMDDYHVA
jgi:hypothetical protein